MAPFVAPLLPERSATLVTGSHSLLLLTNMNCQLKSLKPYKTIGFSDRFQILLSTTEADGTAMAGSSQDRTAWQKKSPKEQCDGGSLRFQRLVLLQKDKQKEQNIRHFV